MKYKIKRYPDGYEYESFLDGKVPEEYKDIVVDELPQDIKDAEKESLRKADARAKIKENLIDSLLSDTKTWEEAQAEAAQIDEDSKKEIGGIKK